VNIEVKLYATLRQYRPDSAEGARHHPFFVELPAGATIASLVSHLRIPEDLVTAAGRNDDAVEVDAALQDGDRVSLFPPTAGG
jgi:molybdopterin converting factor small subunit